MNHNLNRADGNRRKTAADILLAGAGGALLVSAFLALAGLVMSAGGPPDLVPQARSALNTFAWMFLYYLAVAFPLGLLAASAASLFFRQLSPVNILPLVIAALLGIAALVNAAAPTETGAPQILLSLLSNALLGITAAFGAGAAIIWLQNRRLGPWLLNAAVILTPLAVVLFALSVELRNHFAGDSPRRIMAVLLLLAGGLIALLLAAAFARMSQSSKRIGSVLFALGCAVLLAVSLTFGDRPGAFGNGSEPDDKTRSVVTAPAGSPQDPPNVILISIDTLRADGLSCYGNPRQTSPAIDGVASQGVRFQRAYSTSSWTLPAHASMLTGLYTASHGADKTLDQSTGKIADPLLAGIPTLAEKLRDRGYRTAGFISNPWVSSTFGLGRGFDEYDDRINKLGGFMNVKDSLVCRALRAAGIWSERDFDGSRKIEDFLPAVLDWIGNHSGDRFFLFLHFIEPHYVYEPPDRYRLDQSGRPIPIFRNIEHLISGNFSLPPSRLAELQILYEGEIKHIDNKLSELFDLLDRLKLTANTLLIITSDHGESLGEHGLWTHGNSLYEEQLHVPLIMRLPSVIPKARVVDNRLASLVDLMPTILDVVGAPPVQGVQGQSLRPVWEGRSDDVQRAVFAELRPDAGWRRINPDLGRGLRMIRTIDAKYIEGNEGQRELYFTAEDPGEEHNASDAQPELAQTLEQALHGWQAYTMPAGKPGSLKPSPVIIRQLRALGYIK